MIEARGLSKRFRDKKGGEIRAVDNVSFRCEAGADLRIARRMARARPRLCDPGDDTRAYRRHGRCVRA